MPIVTKLTALFSRFTRPRPARTKPTWGTQSHIDILADNLPTAGLAILDFDIDDWTDVRIRRGRLELFVSPRLLKQG